MTIEPNSIEWLSHRDFEAAFHESREADRPVLLDFHDPTCMGCESLERSTYHTADVASAIRDHAIPVRILTTSPDKTVEDILSRYIAISTPTVQLLSRDRTVYHCFRGAPRHTRLALSQ